MPVRSHVSDRNAKAKSPRKFLLPLEERLILRGPRTRAGRRSRAKLKAMGLLIK
jgi:hypothetical protein